MALESGENGMVMPVGPMYGNGNNAFGGDWAWIILLLLLGWGNNGNGFGGNGMNGLYPWMNQADITQSGFQNQALQTQLSSLQNQMNTCCCENRLATANLQAVIQSENCADRSAISEGVRDILVNQTANTQRILDQMCNDKIDAKNERIADLERQLTMANLAASQTAQTAQLLADNTRQTVALEQYLNPTPIPAYVVQNPNCCQQWTGCGCGA